MTMFPSSLCIKILQQNITRSSSINCKHWYHVSRPCYNSQRILHERFPSYISKVQPKYTLSYHRNCNKLLTPVCYQYQDKVFTSIDTSPEFTDVYRFPYIVYARVISRFKIYQTALTAIAVPFVTYSYINGNVPLSGCVAVYSVATLAFVMLYYISRYIQKIVGKIAIDNSQTTVKLSHLTFWGKKKDEYIEVVNFIPFSDMTGEDYSRGILHVKTYQNPQDHYILFIGKYGEIIDHEKYVTIFGQIK